MSRHFEFLLSERKAGKVYLSNEYKGQWRKYIWCQSDLWGRNRPPLNNDGVPMRPGEVVEDEYEIVTRIF